MLILILAGMEDLKASLEKCSEAMKEEHRRLSQLHADKERAKADFNYQATKVKVTKSKRKEEPIFNRSHLENITNEKIRILRKKLLNVVDTYWNSLPSLSFCLKNLHIQIKMRKYLNDILTLIESQTNAVENV